jgi:PAS domain S-box-containing protein
MNLSSAFDTSPVLREEKIKTQNHAEFLQATLDSLAAHIAILNQDGFIIAVNAAWNRFAQKNNYVGNNYGLGANYLDVCRMATGVDSEEAPNVLDGIQSVLSGQRDEFYIEYPCHNPQEKCWFSMRATRFWGDYEANSTRVVVSHENITNRKMVETQLREESEIVESLYRIAQVVAAELNSENIAAAITKAATEISGAQFGLYLPADSENGIPYAFKDGMESPEMVDHFRGQSAKSLLTAQTPLEAYPFSSYLTVSINSRNGERLGVLCLGHEEEKAFSFVQERIVAGLCSQAALAMENARLYQEAKREHEAARESEMRYRFVCDMMPQMVWMTRSDGFHEFYNKQWFDYTGLGQDSYGDGWASPLHPDDVERSELRWNHSLETGEPYEVEYRFKRYDGVYRWFLGRALPLRDKNGQILKWFGTCTDIDDAKQSEVERSTALQREAEARREAEEANRIKDEFLAVVSHELRTPLTPILGWMELLRGEESDEKLREQAYDVIERNARSQSQIVNDLLDVSRIITGKLKLELRPIDLVVVVQSALETVASAALAKNVTLDFQSEENTEPAIGDDERLRQVIWNLVSNAVKFTPKGGNVNVRMSRSNSSVLIEVQDTGVGIESEFLPYVFDRFRQADASSTRRHGGLGLGLSIVRYLVEQHGGEVNVDSEGVGKGSTFSIRLPIVPVMPALDQESIESPSEEALFHASKQALNGLKILVVEDEDDSRDIIVAVLSRHGAIVESAHSVSLALEKLDKFLPDLLVSDIGMPDEDGYSFIQRVRTRSVEQGSKIPALALTAYARTQDKVKALSSGFQNHLAKPVVAAELVVTMAALAGRMTDE